MTLTQVAIFTRRFMLITIILAVLGTVSFVGYSIWHARYLASLPPPEDIPDTRFGILPAPGFVLSGVSSSNFSYQLATETGTLPDFGKLVKVYFISKATATFLAQEKLAELAKKFNIDTPAEATTEGKYLFRKDGQNLTVDINTGNFIYIREASPSAGLLSISEIQLIQNFRNFLIILGVLKEELKNSSAKVDGNQIQIWPADLDQMKIVTASFKKAYVRADIEKDGLNQEDYLSLNFTFWPVDQTTFSTYPIKTTTQALKDLKSGKGSVVVEPKSPKVSITSVYLAYFEGENYTPYLQPIFVFEGPNFVAYVPAITKEYINP